MESVWSRSNHDLKKLTNTVALGKVKRDEDCVFQVLKYVYEYIESAYEALCHTHIPIFEACYDCNA